MDRFDPPHRRTNLERENAKLLRKLQAAEDTIQKRDSEIDGLEAEIKIAARHTEEANGRYCRLMAKHCKLQEERREFRVRQKRTRKLATRLAMKNRVD